MGDELKAGEYDLDRFCRAVEQIQPVLMPFVESFRRMIDAFGNFARLVVETAEADPEFRAWLESLSDGADTPAIVEVMGSD